MAAPLLGTAVNAFLGAQMLGQSGNLVDTFFNTGELLGFDPSGRQKRSADFARKMASMAYGSDVGEGLDLGSAQSNNALLRRLRGTPLPDKTGVEELLGSAGMGPIVARNQKALAQLSVPRQRASFAEIMETMAR